MENVELVQVPYLKDNASPLTDSAAFDLAEDLRIRSTFECERRARYCSQGRDPKENLPPIDLLHRDDDRTI